MIDEEIKKIFNSGETIEQVIKKITEMDILELRRGMLKDTLVDIIFKILENK